MSKNNTFSVCAMVREENAVLERFVQFYLKAGAEMVYLYLDGPDPGFTNPDPSRVQVRSVEETFLAETGKPPETVDLNQKQREIYRVCFRDFDSAWMLFVDADEFLTGPDSIAALLARVPPDVEALNVRNVEAVWGPGDDLEEMFGCSYFRLPMIRWREALTPLVYGAKAPLFRKGLLGHSAGKGFVRRGTQNEYLGSHAPYRNGKGFRTRAHQIDSALWGYVIAHYDAISYPRWREKVRIRIDGTITASGMEGPRELQMLQSKEAFVQGEAASRALFVKLYGLTRYQALVLTGMRRLVRLRPFGETGA